MTSTDLRVVRGSVVNGWRLFRARTPFRILVTTSLIQAVLMCLFLYFLLVRPLSETAQLSALYALTLFPTVGITVAEPTDVPADEKWGGTMPRLRLSDISTSLILVLKTTPVPVFAFSLWLATAIVVTALAGGSGAVIEVAAFTPLVLAAVVSGTSMGITCGVVSLGRRADVAIYNGAIYLVLATSGIVVPPGTFPLLDAAGVVMPFSHAVRGMYATTAEGYLTNLGFETLVGIGWLAVGITLLKLQLRRAARTGIDQFA